MNLRQRILWKPDTLARGIVLTIGIGLTLALGYVHYLSGHGFEFHVFFALPILVVAWFLGFRPGLAVGVWFAAVFIDLDKFKQVNDEQGHDTGDALLCRVAEIFRSQVRAGDIVGRNRILQHVPDEVAR